MALGSEIGKALGVEFNVQSHPLPKSSIYGHFPIPMCLGRLFVFTNVKSALGLSTLTAILIVY